MKTTIEQLIDMRNSLNFIAFQKSTNGAVFTHLSDAYKSVNEAIKIEEALAKQAKADATTSATNG